MDILKEYEKVAQKLADQFVAKYFGKDAEVWWVADEVSGVLYCNDYFFNFLDMVQIIRHKYPKDRMFEYYNYAMECIDKQKNPVSIKNYKKIK